MAHTSFRLESATLVLNACHVVNLESVRKANTLRTSSDIRWAYGCTLIGCIATAGGNLATVTVSRSCTAPCVRWNLPEHSGTAGFEKRWIKIAEERDIGEELANLGKTQPPNLKRETRTIGGRGRLLKLPALSQNINQPQQVTPESASRSPFFLPLE